MIFCQIELIRSETDLILSLLTLVETTRIRSDRILTIMI